MKKIIFSILLMLIFNPVIFAQLWTARYNGTGNGMDAVKDMAVDNSGNVYVTGYSFAGANSNDYITIKYNTNGIQQWIAQYDGTGNSSDIPNSVFVDNSGYVYVTGSSDQLPKPAINDDVVTIKYSPQGTELWVARYDGTIQRDDAGTDVKVDGSGNVYVAGYKTVHNGPQSRKDFLTLKYSSSGILQWAATYNGPGNQDDEAVGLGLDPSGNIYVTGTRFAGNDPLGEQDYFTIKYNPEGVQQWTAIYNGPFSEPDHATAIAVDNAGNSYVTGYSRTSGINMDYETIKYNTDGVQQWAARYGGSAGGSDLAFAIALDNSGNVYVTGGDQTELNNGDYRTIKYNSSGVVQWTARYNGPADDNDYAHALAVDRFGNVYITGYINGTSPSWDIATVKYSSSGIQEWVQLYDGPRDSADVGNTIGVDSLGNVYVAGASTGLNTGWDFTTLKYPSELTGTQTLQENELQSFALFQNYPNPFNPVTLINYQLPKNSYVKLIIYDMRGREVSILVNELQPRGVHKIEWNATNFPSGVYFYRLEAGSFISTMKMLLIK